MCVGGWGVDNSKRNLCHDVTKKARESSANCITPRSPTVDSSPVTLAVFGRRPTLTPRRLKKTSPLRPFQFGRGIIYRVRLGHLTASAVARSGLRVSPSGSILPPTGRSNCRLTDQPICQPAFFFASAVCSQLRCLQHRGAFNIAVRSKPLTLSIKCRCPTQMSCEWPPKADCPAAG